MEHPGNTLLRSQLRKLDLLSISRQVGWLGRTILVILIFDKRQIEKQVPGRGAASMQVSYNRLKAMVETFSTEDVHLIWVLINFVEREIARSDYGGWKK